MTLAFASLARLARRLAPFALVGLVASGCGGGTAEVKTYRPTRLVVFGDEASALIDDGTGNALKYSVNAVDSASGLRLCNGLPIWVQGLAGVYGFVFAECNPNGLTTFNAVMQAKPGAKIEDPTIGLEQQISAELGRGLGTGDLVTVMIGSNDIKDVYDQVQAGTMSQPSAVAEMRRRGGVVAAQVNRLLAANTRAIVVTVPNLGQTPFAVAANLVSSGTSALLSSLSFEFNAYMRTSIDSSKYDGRNYALVLADDVVGAAVQKPSSFLSSPFNVTDGLCTIELPNCTNSADSLVPDSGSGTNSYLWADALHFGPVVHARLASLAAQRAATNPF